MVTDAILFPLYSNPPLWFLVRPVSGYDYCPLSSQLHFPGRII